MRLSSCILVPLLFAMPHVANASASAEDQFYMRERASLEDLLNIKTSVASRVHSELRDTPGLVAVITEEDILFSGARNLIDLLRRVPDFEFAVDVQGNIGLGVRGNSAIEGKVRVIWDGHTYNEILYGTVQFDRFPVEQIERIEIIKGPGSVIYGGLGEMAVINIITKSAGDLNGSRLYAGYGQMRAARGRSFAGYQFGRVYGETAFSALAHVSAAQRSDRTYTDFSGSSYGMNGDSELASKNLNLFLKHGDLSLRFIADDYSLRERDHFGTILATGTARIKFPVYSVEAKYLFPAGDKFRLESKLDFQYSKPWNETDSYFSYDKTVKKYTGGLTAFYEPDAGTCLMGGAEFAHDDIDVGARTSADSSYAGTRSGAKYDNLALYAQTALHLRLFSLTAGGRLDLNSHNGSNLSPRLALTKRIDDLHLKAIFSGGFRAPTAENIRLTPEIKPEHTIAAELEAGYKVGENLFVSANVFDITIRDTILYYYDPAADTENYINSSRSGTLGYGFGLKYHEDGNSLELGYSAYSAAKNRVSYTKGPSGSSAMLAFPRHKAVLNSRYQLSQRLTAAPSLIYLSRRYGYNAAGAIKAYNDIFQADIYFRMRDCFTSGLALGLGVHDILGSNYKFIQSYDGGHAPLPYASRELFLKADYAF
jgi:outer membrane receptor for ferrienterochelin and colicin